MTFSAREFYERHLTLLVPDRVDELVTRQYTPDALLLGPDVEVRGHDELRAHFPEYLRALGGITVLSTDLFVEAEDVLLFEATVETGNYGKVRVYDVWTFRDGRILQHVTGRMS